MPARRSQRAVFDALALDAIDAYVDYSGTIWTTVMKLRLPMALLSIACALAAVVLLLALLKLLFDFVSARDGPLVERYVEVASRVSAMMVGSTGVEMMLDGIGARLKSLPG